MKICDIIQEEAGRVIYHYTSAWAFTKILAENRIGLTLATGSDIAAGQHNAEKVYFLSATRSKVGHYTVAHEGGTTGVVLVLNADFLRNNLSVKPVDYWGREFRSLDPKRNEMEERVFSRNPYIPLPKRPADLILAVHLYVNPKDPDDRFRQSIFQTIVGTKRAGIPLFVYTDKRAWLLQDTRRALPSDQLVGLIQNFPQRAPWGGVSYRRPGSFGGYVELFQRPVTDRERLTKKGQMALRNLTPWGLGDAFNSLNADIHSARGAAQTGHENLVRFMTFLRQAGFGTDIKAFLTTLSQKWYPPEQR